MASLMKCNFLKVQMSAVSPLSPLCLCANRHCSSEHRASGPFSIIVSSNVSLPWSTSIQLSCCPFHSNKSSCYKVIDWFSCRQMGLSTSAPPPPWNLPVYGLIVPLQGIRLQWETTLYAASFTQATDCNK